MTFITSMDVTQHHHSNTRGLYEIAIPAFSPQHVSQRIVTNVGLHPSGETTGDDHDEEQFLGDRRRVRIDELPQARGRLGPGAGSVRDPQRSRGCLAYGF